MHLIDREIENALLSLAKQYPIVTITGPRQSGKTTLVQKLFPNKPYINLENPDLREVALQDPRAFLATIPKGAILDEIQRLPLLLSYLPEIADSRKEHGLFILTGSNQFSLLNDLTQSLAGRTVLLKLLPFSILETAELARDFTADDYLLHGFYPGIYSESLDPTIAYRSYYETYIERDLRQLIHIKDLSLFQRFVRLCAGRVGQLFNASALATEVGVSAVTIASWLSIMQASYIVYLLPPFYQNINKRLVKSAKIYFYDVGLAAYLLGIENKKQLTRDPLRGGLFENMVFMELVKKRANKGYDPNLYFYRDNHGNEVDLLFRSGSSLLPVEIKSAQTFHTDFFRGLYHLKKILPDQIETGYVVYDGELEQRIDTFNIINFRHTAEQIAI
jgi:predicted AAA+ superfamily ATPase